jgi:hypothetical protein
MNIANNLCKIDILLTDYGFVAVLKKLSRSMMAAVERHSVSCKELPHENGQFRKVRFLKGNGHD